jgi:hypothetical protein
MQVERLASTRARIMNQRVIASDVDFLYVVTLFAFNFSSFSYKISFSVLHNFPRARSESFAIGKPPTGGRLEFSPS